MDSFDKLQLHLQKILLFSHRYHYMILNVKTLFEFFVLLLIAVACREYAYVLIRVLLNSESTSPVLAKCH